MLDRSRQKVKVNSFEPQDLPTANLFHLLRHFRMTHTYKYINVNGVRWRYLRNGKGKETILLLPGAPGICETSFQHILLLERTFNVLSVIYPADAKSMNRIIDGLRAILAVEHIDRVHIVGTSYGGSIAQHLISQVPEKIGKLVFVCAGLPNKKTALKYTIYCVALFCLPTKCIHSLLLWRRGQFLSGLTTQQSFWNTYYNQMILSLSKEDYLARLRVWIDFHKNSIDMHKSGVNEDKGILIVKAEYDTVFPAKEQRLLEARYPQAQVYTFLQATHMLAVSQIDDYLEVVLRFLQEKDSEDANHQLMKLNET